MIAFVDITDPAAEMAELIAWLQGIPPSDLQASEALASKLGLHPMTSDWAEITAAVVRRLERLTVLMGRLDEVAGPDLTASVTGALDRLKHVFSPTTQAISWANSKKNYVKAEDGFALFRFSNYARHVQPRRKVSEQELAKHLVAIDEAKGKLYDVELNVWLRDHLIESLERLELVLRHLRFFGHSIAIEETIGLSARLDRIAQQLPAGNAATVVAAAAATVITAVSLFHAPLDIKEGAEFWIKLAAPATRLITHQGGLLEGPPRPLTRALRKPDPP